MQPSVSFTDPVIDKPMKESGSRVTYSGTGKRTLPRYTSAKSNKLQSLTVFRFVFDIGFGHEGHSAVYHRVQCRCCEGNRSPVKIDSIIRVGEIMREVAKNDGIPLELEKDEIIVYGRKGEKQRK